MRNLLFIFTTLLFFSLSTDCLAQIEVKSNNRVGIGTASPSYKLHVIGSVKATEYRSANAVRMRTPYGYTDVGPANSSWSHFITDRVRFYLQKETRINGYFYPYSNNAFSLGASNLYFKHVYAGAYFDGNSGYLCDPSSVSRMNYVLPKSDNLGFCGTSVSTWNYGYFKRLYRQYEYSLSDGRSKENIREIDGALDLVMQLDGKLYDFKADKIVPETPDNNQAENAEIISSGIEGEEVVTSNNEQKISAKDQAEIDKMSARNDEDQRLDNYGFIAQEVKEIIPGVVDYNEQDDVYAMSYTQLIPILVEAIKEQQKQIDALKKQIDEK